MDKANIKWSEIPFGYVKTNCHLEYYFKNGKWSEGTVVEDDRISLNIASTCLHYGQECFEGIKVFENKNGEALLFRGEQNASRMINTAKKLLMEPLPEEIFLESIYKIVKLNKEFIPPHGSGASLYIRPLLLGISSRIGVKPSEEYAFIIFCTPVGPYFKEGLKPIKLLVEETMDRAAPNGIGDVKAGGNYAAGLRVSKKVHDLGYAEALYLDPKEKKYIDESGPANFFAITKDNKYITPKSNSILPSITNDSLMIIAKDMGMGVERRPIHVEEIPAFEEAGCCGTAAVISPVSSITYKNQEFKISKNDEIGPTTFKLYKTLKGIQEGLIEDKYGWIRKIELT